MIDIATAPPPLPPGLQLDGPLQVNASSRQNVFFFSEEPRQRLINYCSKWSYEIWLPYVHYEFEYFWQFNQWYLWGVYMSEEAIPAPPLPGFFASYPALPNFYHERPCTEVKAVDSPHEGIAQLWMETFNREGRLAWHPVWRLLAYRAGCKRTTRREVLSHWETLDRDQVLHLPWRGYRNLI